MSIRVVFRVDANAEIGTGHLMRCLALAAELRRQGAQCAFVCRGAGLEKTAPRITQEGHELLTLPKTTGFNADGLAHSSWLPGGWRNDADASRAALAGRPRADWLIVDHYALDARWQGALRDVAGRIMVIDDLADRDHDCDLLLDQNLPGPNDRRYADHVPTACATLLGPRYALLREEFAAHRKTALATENAEPRLLILFGGADAQDLSGRCVDLLGRKGFQGHVDVIAGPLYLLVEPLAERLAALPSATLHRQPSEVAAIMAGADLALGSPGVSSWERCTLGLPTLAIAVADNQEPQGEVLARAGAIAYLGRAPDVSEAALETALDHLLGNPWARKHMRQMAADICDGLGCRRVARRLLGVGLSLRRAEAEDARPVFAWRNDDRVRRYSLDPSPLDLERHLAWFQRSLTDPARALLIAVFDSTPVGCLRFDFQEASARVSIFLDPERTGAGFATPILEASETWLRRERPDILALQAEILEANVASQRSFLAAGYRPAHTVFFKKLSAPEN